MSQIDTSNEIKELVIFEVGGMNCAIDAIMVIEIIHQQRTTHIHHAPDYVRGVINLRGDIVTVIDLGKKLELSDGRENKEENIIVVPFEGENVGLSVNLVDDIIMADGGAIESPPSNFNGVEGAYFSGIYKMEDALVAILNIERVLRKNTDQTRTP